MGGDQQRRRLLDQCARPNQLRADHHQRDLPRRGKLLAGGQANAYGSKTSVVAQVTVGAAFSELYDTGTSTNGIVDTNNLPGKPDPHYTLIASADASQPGPDALVWNMFALPIANQGGNFSKP